MSTNQVRHQQLQAEDELLLGKGVEMVSKADGAQDLVYEELLETLINQNGEVSLKRVETILTQFRQEAKKLMCRIDKLFRGSNDVAMLKLLQLHDPNSNVEGDADPPHQQLLRGRYPELEEAARKGDEEIVERVKQMGSERTGIKEGVEDIRRRFLELDGAAGDKLKGKRERFYKKLFELEKEMAVAEKNFERIQPKANVEVLQRNS